MKKKESKEEKADNSSTSEDRTNKELSLDDIKDLPLIDNDFFLFAFFFFTIHVRFLPLKNYTSTLYYGNNNL